jgi:hypothetical protein
MRIARDLDEGHQSDDHRAGNRRVLGAQLPRGVLEHLGLVLEQEDRRPPHRADVDRLEGRIEDEHPASITPAPPVLMNRRGPHSAWWCQPPHGKIWAEV